MAMDSGSNRIASNRPNILAANITPMANDTIRSRLVCGRAGGARRSQNQKNSVVSSPRAVTNDSTSIPSLKTIFTSTSAALNESAEAMPGSKAILRASADTAARYGV